jgi:hypothetical protein
VAKNARYNAKLEAYRPAGGDCTVDLTIYPCCAFRVGERVGAMATLAIQVIGDNGSLVQIRIPLKDARRIGKVLVEAASQCKRLYGGQR